MNEILKKFSIIKEVTSYEWEVLRKLVETIKLGTSKIIDIDNRSNWKEYDKEKLSIMDNWSTYSGCYNLEFTYNKNNIICTATIFDGDSYRGNPTNLRFIVTIELFIDFYNIIEREINNRFEQYLEDEYENYLEIEKQKWIKDKKDFLLNVVNKD
jgi:hypothetical protein